MTSPLRHFVEETLESLGPRLAYAFPAYFDWAELCRDTPAMLERATDGAFDATDAGASHVLQSRADQVFRFAHVATLALISAADADTSDPVMALAGFAAPPEDDEEARFETLVRDELGAIEQSFEEEDFELGDLAYELRERVVEVWPYVHELMEENDVLDRAETPSDAAIFELARPLLLAIVRLAAILAAMRWDAGYPDDDADR